MTDDRLIAVLGEAAAAVADALRCLDDWGPAGTRTDQYRSDLIADEAAVPVLVGAGLGVLSEESGRHDPNREVTVVLDPVDGSINASRALPWYATSLCAVDGRGPRAAVVVNQATGDRYQAIRGGGAMFNESPVQASACERLTDALVGLNEWSPTHLGWYHVRTLGSAALDICAVGAGQLDAYIDFSTEEHAPWDYLGGLLVCREAGAFVADACGRELVTLGGGERRAIVAAATAPLLAEAAAVRGRGPIPEQPGC